MDWLLILVVAAGAAVVSRIYVSVRKARHDQMEDWDVKVLEKLRASGRDPFQPAVVDFFLAVPTEAACQQASQRLRGEGFEVSVRQMKDAEFPYSVAASKTMRLSAPEMRELSRRFTQLARDTGGRYDGWV